MKPGFQSEHPAQAGAEDQSSPVPGDGSALHAAARPAAAPQAGAPQQSLPRHGRAGGRGGGRGRDREPRASRRDGAEEKDEKDEIDWEEILLDGFDAGGRREEHEEREYYEPVTVDTRDLARPPPRPGQPPRARRRARCCWPTSSSATSTRTATSPAGSTKILDGVNESRPAGRRGGGARPRRPAAVHASTKPRRCSASSRASIRRASARATCASACMLQLRRRGSSSRCRTGSSATASTS